ncbi:hypothetical protein PCANC_00264 [Puccinia coronata f. sp. avenae]|uniref:ATP-dependent DNA ligase family profile domain-containing protein n=1 Tax=Puccinia coronata f. sp. avenae TaxID=200324 RepID=A0A2N5W8Y4_9BASI|nr:hypothetical protein PCANC_00264 [Puccinia coronata f. sp. avenae]
MTKTGSRTPIACFMDAFPLAAIGNICPAGRIYALSKCVTSINNTSSTPTIMVNHRTTTASQDITFASLCSYLDRVASRKPRRTGTRNPAAHDSPDTAAEEFLKWADNLRWPVPRNTGKTLFRLLFPDHDVRRKYDLQEPKLAKQLSWIHDAPGKGRELLLNWKSTTEDQNGIETGKAGCLGLELESIRNEMDIGNPRSLKLSDLDLLLDELALSSRWSNIGTHSFRKPYRRPSTVLRDIYARVSPRESAYITQIILKDLRPLLNPIPSLSVYKSLIDYDSKAFQEITPYSIMKAWHWAMPRIYRAKADYDVAADLCEKIPRDRRKMTGPLEELLQNLIKPQLGTPVNIPKAVKASGPCLAAPLSKLKGQIWAETKMDGERMQIHVDASKPEAEQIQIFSKSHRDSTEDRASTLHLIRATLGLQSSSTSELLESHPRPTTFQSIESGIFEAEMVAWNLAKDQVDEFWRISEMKNTPWGRPKGVDNGDKSVPEFTESQIDGMDTQQLSDLDSRHLALCFFDVIYLNGQSLLERSYNERRQTLETCIHVIPQYSMLVERKSFDLSRESAQDELRKYYATVIAQRHEGLVIKTADSIYNDSRSEHKWLKVKKDYITGFGDTADYAIVGASWDRDRGRELRVPTSTCTTWYIGLCDNTLEIKRDPSLRPNFQIVFACHSYGLSRRELEKVNQIANDIGGSKPNFTSLQSWPFTYKLAKNLQQPRVIFKEPLVFELMGSGFTKQSRNHEYELRWPRITKFHQPGERNWSAAIDLETHNKIAKRATDPQLLHISDLISGGSQEKAEDGFQAELEHWTEKFRSTDLKWLRRSDPRYEVSEDSARPEAPPQKVQGEKPMRRANSKSDRQSEGSAHASSSVTTPEKSGTAKDADCPEIIEIKSDTEQTLMKTPRKQSAGVSPAPKVTPASGQNSTRPPAKRKAPVSSNAPTVSGQNPSRRTRLSPFVKMDKNRPAASSKELDSEFCEGPDAKRRKTSDRNRPPEISSDNQGGSTGQASNQGGSTHQKDAGHQVTSASVDTPRKQSKDINETPTEKKSGIPTQAPPVNMSSLTPKPKKSFIQTPAPPTKSSVTPKREKSFIQTQAPPANRLVTAKRKKPSIPTQVPPINSSITPQRNYFSHDLLDIEKFDSPAFGGFGYRDPVTSPIPPGTTIPDKTGLSNVTPGPAASSSTSAEQPAIKALASHQTHKPSTSSSTSGPSVSRDASRVEKSARPEIGHPAVLETSDTNDSAPPWRQNPDVRWCLIRDEHDYGISGTRFRSVDQLLESMRRDPDDVVDRKPESGSHSYIFIENPSPANLTRIQKQILFRPLSDPNVGIVGYDAKVLKLAPNNPVTSWQSFELFRFNSFHQEFPSRPAQT